MQKKIITFTMSPRQSQFEVDRLEEEAKKMNVPVLRAMYREISFKLSNPSSLSRVFVQGEEVTGENTLGLWFRVAGTVSGKYTEGRNLAIRLLQDRILCVNAKSYLGWPRMGKIAQHGVFIINSIPIVPTRIFYTKSQICGQIQKSKIKNQNYFGEWEYPVICKHDRGYQGKSVRKFESAEQIGKWLDRMDEKNLGMFLWQKYLPTKWDIRVIVIKGEAVGAMKRIAVGKEFRSNFSLGGAVEKWKLEEKDRELAEKVAGVCGLDYCGVDIMKDEFGNSFVLEVNRQCQFKGFEQATGVNVAKLVVEMLNSYV